MDKRRKIHIPAPIDGPGVQRCERCHAKLRTITEDDWENGSRGWRAGVSVSSDGRGNMSVFDEDSYQYPEKIFRNCGKQVTR